MKKFLIYLSALALVLLLSAVFFPLRAGADLGDFNDYDSGSDSSWGSSDSDWGSSDSDWSSSDSDSDSGGGRSRRSSDSGGEWKWYYWFLLPFIVLTPPGAIALSLVLNIIKKILEIFHININFGKKSKRRPTAKMPAVKTPVVKDHTSEIITAIKKIDPQFAIGKFISWVNEVFLTLQYAWSARDWEKVRPFEKEELYKQHEMQIRQYIDNNRINVLQDITVEQAYLQKYVRDKDYEYLTVFIHAKMIDYIKDEKTGKVLKGSLTETYNPKYLYTFMRKTGVLTGASSNRSTKNCPNCGAEIRITSAGKCGHCNSVITTGEFDWVLSNIDGVKPQTIIDDSAVIIR